MKVSIITVCKNSENSIERAIESVVGQNYGNVEYIIIDDKSTDSTLSIIDKYKSNIDISISESDTGIYNAMNKGIKYSTGDILYFLNSDDYLIDYEVIADISSAFVENSDSMIIYGNVFMADDRGKRLVKYKDIDSNFFYKNTICHQAVFARKELFGEIGGFNEKYKIHADVDWLMRVYFNTENVFKYFDRTICFFSNQGFCSNPINAEKHKFDRQEISAKYFLEAKYKLMIKKLLIQLGLMGE